MKKMARDKSKPKRVVAKVGQPTKKDGHIRAKPKATANQLAYRSYVKNSGCMKQKGIKGTETKNGVKVSKSAVTRSSKCSAGWDKVNHKPKAGVKAPAKAIKSVK